MTLDLNVTKQNTVSINDFWDADPTKQKTFSYV